MKLTRVSSDANGESYFQDVEVTVHDAGPIGRLSALLPASGIIFRENDADYDYDWHNAPQKQYIVMLDGEIEIEVSAGERRIFRGGDILLVEDVTGKGHRTRTVNSRPRRSIFVVIP